jgi:hypothetical protein
MDNWFCNKKSKEKETFIICEVACLKTIPKFFFSNFHFGSFCKALTGRQYEQTLKKAFHTAISAPKHPKGCCSGAVSSRKNYCFKWYFQDLPKILKSPLFIIQNYSLLGARIRPVYSCLFNFFLFYL